MLLAFSVGNPLVTGEFFSQWTINKDIRTKSWWLSSQCVIIHKSSKRCTNILCHRNNDKRRHQKNTYLRIMENIHPNHNPLSKSLMLWSNTNANFRYYHISSIMHMWKQINNDIVEITILSLLITGNTHPNHLGLYWCIFPNPVPEKIMSYFTSYKQQEFLLLLNLYLVLPSWYCIIPALLLQHLADQQSPI